jgi:hypothetical protein
VSDGWDFWVSIAEHSSRYADWLEVYGNDPSSPVRVDRVPVTTPIAERVQLPIGVRPVFFVKLDLLSPEQRERLVRQICDRFHLSRGKVEAEFTRTRGSEVPILDEDVFVTILHPQKWLY